MSQYQAVQAKLEEQLTRLLQRVSKIEGDLRQPHSQDWPEQANELENDEVLQGLDALSIAQVRRIRAALQRIANGTYGVCAICGTAIGAERLAAMPDAASCLACSNDRSTRM
jgi:RNA polymerase-binding transcription factor DksA